MFRDFFYTVLGAMLVIQGVGAIRGRQARPWFMRRPLRDIPAVTLGVVLVLFGAVAIVSRWY